MPKIIKNLENKIFEVAKEELYKNGYKNLSVRMIADRCSIALGTIYNYYPSKEILVSMIINDDWQKRSSKSVEEALQATSLHEAIQVFSDTLCDFTKSYLSIFSEYSYSDRSSFTAEQMHVKLISFIKTCMNKFYEKFNVKVDDYSNEIFAEALIIVAVKGADYSKAGSTLERLLNI